MWHLRWWLPVALFAAGCIATGSLAQTGRPQETEVTQQLEIGKTIERQLAGGQSHEYHFTLAAGQYARVLVEQIDDRTTAEVMKRFYEEMLARGERPAAALRAAQVATWKTRGWDAPYYWAAFTLQGEWW
jgi:CHAT domain